MRTLNPSPEEFHDNPDSGQKNRFLIYGNTFTSVYLTLTVKYQKNIDVVKSPFKRGIKVIKAIIIMIIIFISPAMLIMLIPISVVVASSYVYYLLLPIPKISKKKTSTIPYYSNVFISRRILGGK
jgi:hypothetical protein